MYNHVISEQNEQGIVLYLTVILTNLHKKYKTNMAVKGVMTMIVVRFCCVCFYTVQKPEYDNNRKSIIYLQLLKAG